MSAPDVSFTSETDLSNLLVDPQHILIFGSTGTIGKGAVDALRKLDYTVTPVARKESTDSEEGCILWEEFLSYKHDSNVSSISTLSERLQAVTTIISCIGGFVTAQTKATASTITQEQIKILESKVFLPNLHLYQQTIHLHKLGCFPNLNRLIFITGTNGEAPENSTFCAASLADAKLMAFIKSAIKEQQDTKDFKIVEVRLGLRFTREDKPHAKVPSYASKRLGAVFDSAITSNDQDLIRITSIEYLDPLPLPSSDENIIPKNKRGCLEVIDTTIDDDNITNNLSKKKKITPTLEVLHYSNITSYTVDTKKM